MSPDAWRPSLAAGATRVERLRIRDSRFAWASRSRETFGTWRVLDWICRGCRAYRRDRPNLRHGERRASCRLRHWRSQRLLTSCSCPVRIVHGVSYGILHPGVEYWSCRLQNSSARAWVERHPTGASPQGVGDRDIDACELHHARRAIAHDELRPARPRRRPRWILQKFARHVLHIVVDGAIALRR